MDENVMAQFDDFYHTSRGHRDSISEGSQSTTAAGITMSVRYQDAKPNMVERCQYPLT